MNKRFEELLVHLKNNLPLNGFRDIEVISDLGSISKGDDLVIVRDGFKHIIFVECTRPSKPLRNFLKLDADNFYKVHHDFETASVCLEDNWTSGLFLVYRPDVLFDKVYKI